MELLLDMNQKTVRSGTPYRLFPEFTFPTSLFKVGLVDTSMWNPRDSGLTTIDINISLYDNNTQNTTSVSFSNELETESVKEVQQLIETFVKAVEQVFSKESLGDTPKE